MIALRPATPADAAAIAHLMAAAWHDEPPDMAHITRTLVRGNRTTLVAENDGQVLGFIDAFGTTYWELDLMAVDPAAQGKGIGKLLTHAVLSAGQVQGYTIARGLVAISNIASQRVLRRLGLTPGDHATLFVHDGQAAEAVLDEADVPITEVHTFRYTGGWLTAPFTSDMFFAAAALCLAQGWGTVGAVIPNADPAAHTAAQTAGYQRVGDYQWWQMPLMEG